MWFFFWWQWVNDPETTTRDVWISVAIMFIIDVVIIGAVVLWP